MKKFSFYLIVSLSASIQLSMFLAGLSYFFLPVLDGSFIVNVAYFIVSNLAGLILSSLLSYPALMLLKSIDRSKNIMMIFWFRSVWCIMLSFAQRKEESVQ